MYALKNKIYPFTIFWLGVLTGAIIITSIFLYRLYSEVSPASTFGPYYPSVDTLPMDLNEDIKVSDSMTESGYQRKSSGGVQVGEPPDS